MFKFFNRKPVPPRFPSCVFYCLKEKCPLWVKLQESYTGKQPQLIGKCAIAWLPTLLVELKNAVLEKKKKK